MHHPLAVIHPKAVIGENVTIGPFVSIEENVVIGDGSWIGSNAVIMSGARIGKNCKIFPGAVVSSIPQDLKFKGEDTVLEIGDNTVIREYCTLNRGTLANKRTVIGSNSLLMAYVHVAHDCEVGDNCILANNATLAGHVVIEDNVILGGMVAVQQFTKIGAFSMLGGGVLLNKDVPPFVRVARYPASFIGVNVIGLKRNGFSSDAIDRIEDIYHRLFVASQNRTEAIKLINSVLPDSPEKSIIMGFVENSQNGIIKGPKRGA
jgi:UDP-N-acetylglucosamine acyltransferase